MTLPSHAPLRKLYRLSVSQNIYRQIVFPLTDLLYGEKPTHADVKDIEKTLVELHKCFWNDKGPLEFPGAVGGRFEELLFPLRHAQKEDGRYIKMGAEGKTGEQKQGGDVTVYKTDGQVVTYQLKVANSAKEENLIEHINKAGAQLTGQTGEMPEHGSERVVYLLVQNTEAFESYTLAQWKALVEKALDKDYVSERKKKAKEGENGEEEAEDIRRRTVSAASIKDAVDKIKIFTRSARFTLVVVKGKVEIPYNAVKEASASKHFAYTNSQLELHWEWLMKWFRNVIEKLPAEERTAIMRFTKEKGVAGDAKAWQELPFQT